MKHYKSKADASAALAQAPASQLNSSRTRATGRNETVLCIGHAFARNYGDRAIFYVLKEALARHAGLRARPFPIKPVLINRYGHLMSPLEKLVRGMFILPPHYVRLWRHARASRAVLMGSGNPMMDIFPLHPIQFLLSCLVVRAAGRRFWIFGGGAGPLESWIGRTCVSVACRLAENVSVRDSFSVKDLRKCYGLDRVLNPTIIPDLVLSQELPQRRHDSDTPFTLGISAIHYRRPGRSPDADSAAYTAYLDRVEQVIRLAVDRLHAAVIVFTNEPMEDQDTVNDLVARVADLPQVRAFEPVSVRSAVETAGACDVHVGGRLHSVIFSLIQGVPAIALSSHRKIVGFYTDLDAHDLVYDIGDFDPEEILKSIQQLRGDRGRILLEKVAQMRRESAAGLAAIADTLRRFVDHQAIADT